MRPSEWREFINTPGDYIFAFSHHFIAARRSDNGLQVNLGHRTHMWQGFLLESGQAVCLRRCPCTQKIILDPALLDCVFKVVESQRQRQPSLQTTAGGSFLKCAQRTICKCGGTCSSKIRRMLRSRSLLERSTCQKTLAATMRLPVAFGLGGLIGMSLFIAGMVHLTVQWPRLRRRWCTPQQKNPAATMSLVMGSGI